MISRVNETALRDFASTLLPKLIDIFDGRTWPETVGFLNVAMVSNEYYFVHSDNAILLVQKIQKKLRRVHDIEEIFGLCRDIEKHKDELKDLYLAAFEWGKRNGSATFDLDNCSDLKESDFRALFKKCSTEKIPYAVIQ